jgi:hypothetical protein
MAAFNCLNSMENHLLGFMATRNPKKDKVAIIAAHHPIVFDPNTKLFAPATEPAQKGSFGGFTNYSAELGARLVRKGKEMNVPSKIALLVDDHSQVGDPEWYYSAGVERIHPAMAEIIKGVTGAQASYRLPECLANNLITEYDMVFSKLSGSFAFFESQYRLKFGKDYPNERVGCAGEVNLIYQELSEQGFNNVIAFFPIRCQGPVCNAATQYNILRKDPKAGLMRQKRLIVVLGTEQFENYSEWDINRDIETLKQRLEDKVYSPFLAGPWLENLKALKHGVETMEYEKMTLKKTGEIAVHIE